MIRTRSQSTRASLMIGASAVAIMLSAVPAAGQDMFRRAPRDPAAQAAQAAAQRATQNQAASTATQRTIEAFQRASQLRQRMDQAQQAARAAAAAAQANIPNGLRPGGLQFANGVDTDPNLWIGADRPTEATADGRTMVTVDQTRSQAILTWDSFNVGRETDLVFDQQGNTSWSVLNRVTDVTMDPSRILGTIKADGTVMILNRNGVIFGGTSQVNARNLVAAAAEMTNDQFLTRGIYSQLEGGNYLGAFTNAGGDVRVDAGAQLKTAAPDSVLEGGGYVVLLGTNVENAGAITTQRGQTLLAAGDEFLFRPGYGTEANQISTTRGNEVRALIGEESTAGAVTNTGQIEAAQGDITLTGRTILQDGILLSTTSVNQRGSIHLLNSASDADGLVTLTGDSLTAILPELDSEDTALNSQRDAIIADSAQRDLERASTITNPGGQFDNLARLSDRRDQSRVEIVSGGDVLFDAGSTMLAQGGQVAVTAADRVQANAGAVIDVSGVRGVALDMASNAIKVNIQPNEMRDSPINRETGFLNNKNVWVDVRDLVLVDGRYYTPGGLLEVGGYLGNQAHGIGEWASVGGTITLSAAEVVVKQGSVLNIAGGSLDYASGWLPSTRVLGADGKLYNLNEASAHLRFMAVGNALVVEHPRWGAIYTQVYSTPLFSRGEYLRHEDGYTVGRDGGQIVLSAPTVLLDGDIVADVIAGSRQVRERPNGPVDGYKLSPDTVALAGGLTLGRHHAPTLSSPLTTFATDVRITDVPDATAADFGLGSEIAADRVGTAWFDASQLTDSGLGNITLASSESILVDSDLTLVDGGRIELFASQVDIAANLTVLSGEVNVGTVVPFDYSERAGVLPQQFESSLTLHNGATIDTRGVWVNAVLDPNGQSGRAHLDGGSVTFDSHQGVIIEAGSVIDVSSGAALLADGTFIGGRGGDVTLIADHPILGGVLGDQSLVLDGQIRAIGASGGGKLTLHGGRPVIVSEGNLVVGDYLEGGTAAPFYMIVKEDVDLEAGDTAPVDVVLDAFTLPAGFTLPIDLTVVIDAIPAGTPLSTDYQFPGASLDDAIVLAADWTVPPHAEGIYTTEDLFYNSPAQPGDVIPAGYHIYPGYGQIRAEVDGQPFVVPSDAFPDGLPISPETVQFSSGTTLTEQLNVPAGLRWSAGTPLPGPARLNAGTRLVEGSVSSRTIEIEPILNLDASLFQTGFADYVIDSLSAVSVLDGVTVSPVVPVIRLRADSYSRSSGVAPSEVLETWQPPLFQEDAIGAVLQQRHAANLTLRAVNLRQNAEAQLDAGVRGVDLGRVRIGEGASINVDPGASVHIEGWGQVDVLGSITAPGGEVALLNTRPLSISLSADPMDLSVVVGEHSVIDVSGRSWTALDANGREYGIVQDGGRVALGFEPSQPDPQDGMVPSTDAYVIVREGARIEASGAAGRIDLSAGLKPSTESEPVLWAGNGGEISASSYSGIVLDGTMIAEAGGEGAFGGTLSLAIETPNYQRFRNFSAAFPVDIPSRLLNPRTLIVAGNGAAEHPQEFGEVRVSVAQVEAGAFASLSLESGGAILFDGDVDLSLARSLRLASFMMAGSNSRTDVRLAAPVVSIEGMERPRSDESVAQPSSPSAALSDSLTISGSLIDVRGPSRSNFLSTVLESTGDIRLLAAQESTLGSVSFLQGTVFQSGDLLTLRAAQIYPGTGVEGAFFATSMSEDAPSRIVVERIAGEAPPAPLSIFGTLALFADEIEQGGILRAPFGTVELGRSSITNDLRWNIPFGDNTEHVALLPGSITSISGVGLAMPYGGTSDGLVWRYRGADVSLREAAAEFSYNSNNGAFKYLQGVSFNSAETDIQEGATVDVRGGGDLLGAGFVSGRGGSVDLRLATLAESNPAWADFGGAGVYAIVPSYTGAFAPDAGSEDAGAPGLGRAIEVPEGVAGLPAGRYTLLPSSFATLPGAFRVEIGGAAQQSDLTVPLPAGSVYAGTRLGYSYGGSFDPRPVATILTPGQALRQHSLYNETSFNSFAASQVGIEGRIRPWRPADAGGILLANLSGARPFSNKGLVLATGADGGFGADVTVAPQTSIEILGPGGTPTEGMVSLFAEDLNALNAGTFAIGRTLTSGPLVNPSSTAGDVYLRDGATLRASQVIIVGGFGGDIHLESGSAIDTTQSSTPTWGASDGYYITPNYRFEVDSASAATLVVSNRGAVMLPANVGAGAITIDDGASLLTKGDIAILAPSGLSLSGDAILGARNLSLSLNAINIGTADTLTEAEAAGVLPDGWALTQDRLDQLIEGDATRGIPRLEGLRLLVSTSINFVGDVTLDTTDPISGKSRTSLTFDAPAIYGLGEADDVASLISDTIVWNGVYVPEIPQVGAPNVGGPGGTLPPPQVLADGPGTGQGTLNLIAREMILGYAPGALSQDEMPLPRLALGFSTVNLTGRDRITTNSRGSLSVFESGTDAESYSGGNLNLITPLLTSDPGAVFSYIAGSGLVAQAPNGAASADTSKVATLGGELRLRAPTVSLDTAVALPSGRLVLDAAGDVTLGAHADIDLSGRSIQFFDQTRHTWGGELVGESAGGSILQAAGSSIDVSAAGSDAGFIQLTATNGAVDLAGSLLGSGAEGFDGGHFDVRALTIGDFGTFNTRLNEGGFFGARTFVIKTGDIVVGDEVRARNVTISADGGSLTVNGSIDASGARVGSIRLSARDDLILGSGAVLDASGSVLKTDGYGVAIDASNTARIELASAEGRVVLSEGASFDLSSADNVDRGKLEIDARRVGADDIAIDAGGRLTVRGAASVAVNGFRTYSLEDGVINQAGMDAIHSDSAAFIDAALSNGALRDRLAGLAAHGSDFHLRPGVELTSGLASGDIRVDRDLDLSVYRYGPGADGELRGSGEPGKLIIRAAGDLIVNGSITDGFGLPPATPDDGSFTQLVSLSFGVPAPIDIAIGEGWVVEQDWAFVAGDTLPIAVSLPPELRTVLEAGTPASDRIDVGNGSTVIYTVPEGGLAVPPNSALFTLVDGGLKYYELGRGTPEFIPAGEPIVYATALPGGVLPFDLVAVSSVTLPAGTILTEPLTIPAGTSLPSGGVILAGMLSPVTGSFAAPEARPTWAAAPMLAPGSQSWSLELASGADVASADARTLAALSSLGGRGDLILNDQHAVPSVIRTGTGDLHLSAGRDFRFETAFGVYTAGTQSSDVGPEFNLPQPPLQDGDNHDALDAVNAQISSYYPDHGGDLTVSVQRNYLGERAGAPNVNQWILRQGGPGEAAAWSINFGRYMRGQFTNGFTPIRFAAFTGLATLGGGNLDMTVGGQTGSQPADGGYSVISLAVASSGRVIDGEVVQTGGGDLTVRVGGDLERNSPGAYSRWQGDFPSWLAPGVMSRITNLRGDIDVSASAIGSLQTFARSDVRGLNPFAATNGFGVGPMLELGDGAAILRTRGDLAINGTEDPGTLPVLNPRIVALPAKTIFPGVEVQGTATVLEAFTMPAGTRLQTDLYLPDDPQTLPEGSVAPFFVAGGGFGGGPFMVTSKDIVMPSGGSAYGEGFREYVPGERIPAGTPLLYAQFVAGTVLPFDVTTPAYGFGQILTKPVTVPAGFEIYQGSIWPVPVTIAGRTGYLSTGFRLTTADSSLDLFSVGGDIAHATPRGGNFVDETVFPMAGRGETAPATVRSTAASGSIYMGRVDLAPAPAGQLELLAAETITGNRNLTQPGSSITISGNDTSFLSTPLQPLWLARNNFRNIGGDFYILDTNADSFGPDAPSGTLHLGDPAPALIYAIGGDILNLDVFSGKSLQVRAGGDLINPTVGIVNDDPSDVSLLWAGRDILYVNANIAGPGNLDVRAGRNLYQGSNGGLGSSGAVPLLADGSLSNGASISVTVGAGADGPDYDAFAHLYLDPANLADPNRPLENDPINEGKVAKTYEAELLTWLRDVHGYEGDSDGALEHFFTLRPEQQAVFVRKVYYEELRQGGREHNDPDSRRFESYLRGRMAIATLFPGDDYSGDLTMFGGSSVLTNFGGDIQFLVPGGRTIIGVEGEVPPSSAGLLTRGSGNIQLYSEGSILLGLSRVFTTFGGDITMWSAEGDINAGRGAKGTVVYAPARRTYDLVGNVALSPTVPTSGAGIATLDPIPEIPPGDIDLVAPLGTVDAGEAGIRVSGDINIAALRIVNAANIEVKGEATGLPATVAVNTGALTAASAASAAISNEAAQLAERARPRPLQDPPSIVTSRLLGFGE